jgi:hypothetical protein
MQQYRVRLFGFGVGDPLVDTGMTVQGVPFPSYTALVCEVMAVHGVPAISSAQVHHLNGPDAGVVVSLLHDVCDRLPSITLYKEMRL